MIKKKKLTEALYDTKVSNSSGRYGDWDLYPAYSYTPGAYDTSPWNDEYTSERIKRAKEYLKNNYPNIDAQVLATSDKDIYHIWQANQKNPDKAGVNAQAITDPDKAIHYFVAALAIPHKGYIRTVDPYSHRGDWRYSNSFTDLYVSLAILLRHSPIFKQVKDRVQSAIQAGQAATQQKAARSQARAVAKQQAQVAAASAASAVSTGQRGNFSSASSSWQGFEDVFDSVLNSGIDVNIESRKEFNNQNSTARGYGDLIRPCGLEFGIVFNDGKSDKGEYRDKFIAKPINNMGDYLYSNKEVKNLPKRQFNQYIIHKVNDLAANGLYQNYDDVMDVETGEIVKIVESLNRQTKINIRESLNAYDVRSDNKYDLRNLYDSCILSDEEKRTIAEMISKKVRANVLYEALMNKFQGKALTESIKLGGGMSLPYETNYCIFVNSRNKTTTIVKVNSKKEFTWAESIYGGFINVYETPEEAEKFVRSFTGPAKDFYVKIIDESLKEGIQLTESATMYMSSEHTSDKEDIYYELGYDVYSRTPKTYYGYATIYHPTLGEFSFSFDIDGKEIRTDGFPWEFLQRKKYRLTPDQIKYLQDHSKEIKRAIRRGMDETKLTEEVVVDGFNKSLTEGLKELPQFNRQNRDEFKEYSKQTMELINKITNKVNAKGKKLKKEKLSKLFDIYENKISQIIWHFFSNYHKTASALDKRFSAYIQKANKMAEINPEKALGFIHKAAQTVTYGLNYLSFTPVAQIIKKINSYTSNSDFSSNRGSDITGKVNDRHEDKTIKDSLADEWLFKLYRLDQPMKESLKDSKKFDNKKSGKFMPFYVDKNGNLTPESEDNYLKLKSKEKPVKEWYDNSHIIAYDPDEETLDEDWYDDEEDDWDDGEDKYTLVGVDGNAYAIMGYTANALKREGLRHLVDQMYKEATSGDYYNLIVVCCRYVDKANAAARGE